MPRIAVVGGGLGGLTAAALLAKRGYRVTLIEKHRVVGGAVTALHPREGLTVETALRTMPVPASDPDLASVFEELEIEQNLELVKPEEFFRVTSKDFDFTMPWGRDEAVAALSERYPSDADGIAEYFDLIDSLAEELHRFRRAKWLQRAFCGLCFSQLRKYRNLAVREVLDDLLESEELKLVLNANVAQYHGSSSTLSILAHAAGQSAYYQHGGCYVKGGAQNLVDHLAHVIRHNGGDILTRTEAISIDVDDGRVRTITYRNASGTVTSRTDAVVSNLSPEQSYELASQKHKEERTAADSLLSVYLGFDKDLRSVYGKQAFCQFMLREFAGIDDYDAAIEGDVGERGFCFADYSQLDSALCEEGTSYGLVVAPDFLARYEKLDDEQYRQKKEEAVESFLAALEERYPGIRDRVEYSEVGTPLTLQRYLRTPQGTPYGFAPTPEQYFRRPAVSSECVKNLFFASAWAISGGFAPVMAVANLCCERIAKQAPPPVVEAGE